MEGDEHQWANTDRWMARELPRMDGAWAFGIEATICVR
jgi:hypothetical protein